MFANTPKPPYYAVIFSSTQTKDTVGYNEMADRMLKLTSQQDGFLGIESVREKLGITVSYWTDLASIKDWKENTEHLFAQEKGKHQWYSSYKIRISLVEKDYEFG